jgi:transcriptional regulator with XRE-family HTH domain
MSDKILSSAQCLGARAMLGMTRADLAAAAKVSAATLADFEAGKREPYARTLADIRGALEVRGILFLADGEQADGGPGVRLVRQV